MLGTLSLLASAPTERRGFSDRDMADVAYLIQDMLFSSKVRETAKPMGLTLQGSRDVAGLVAAARAGRSLRTRESPPWPTSPT